MIHKIPLIWAISEDAGDKSDERCTIADLFIKPGQFVKKDFDVLAVIETDKATGDFSSPYTGEILEVYVEAGNDYPYGSDFCTIDEK